ncbi:hypothetical protein WISP_80336 [Willisornis vidua]|uniref:Uncharacterized protein n=1 Tax=Willisornis vidua TaxID=1566151 RepID=A0ABQ9D588_9PASS|nr:hypothetical protein WISP_80336 [Willisornis vidua]
MKANREVEVGSKENNLLDMFSKEENYLLIGEEGQLSQTIKTEGKSVNLTLEQRISKGQISVFSLITFQQHSDAVIALDFVLDVFSLGSVILGFSLRSSKMSYREVKYFSFPGELLMRMLQMLVLPLIVSSLVTANSSVKLRTLLSKLFLYLVIEYFISYDDVYLGIPPKFHGRPLKFVNNVQDVPVMDLLCYLKKRKHGLQSINK